MNSFFLIGILLIIGLGLLIAFFIIRRTPASGKSKWLDRFRKEPSDSHTDESLVGLSEVGDGAVAVRRNPKKITPVANSNFFQKTSNETDIKSLYRSYFNWVMSRTRVLTLSGIDSKASKDKNEHLKLAQIYTPLLTKSTRSDKANKKGPSKISALEMLNKEKKLVLLGDPGSGKSSFVNFVACCLAGENIENKNINLNLLTRPLPKKDGKDDINRQRWSHGPLLPVVINLKDFMTKEPPGKRKTGRAYHLWNYIEQELTDANLDHFSTYLEEELRNNGALILMDGLDEVPEANDRRGQLIEIIEDFMHSFDRCRFLVTSRTYAYKKQNFNITGVKSTVLSGFGSGQIIRFINQWYNHLTERQLMHRSNSRTNIKYLKQTIFGNSRIRELSESPLLLTLLASLHAWRGGNLPENREELYADAVDLLFDWWVRPKSLSTKSRSNIDSEPGLLDLLNIDRTKMRQFLNELAYKVHSSQQELMGTADITEKNLVSGIINIAESSIEGSKKIISDYLSNRAGLLIPKGIKLFAFPHRNIQEYLAACFLTDEDFPDQIVELTRNDFSRWREVAILAGAKAAKGTSNNLWLLSDKLCSENEPTPVVEDVQCANIAGQALSEFARLDRVTAKNKNKLERIKRWLVHIIRGKQLSAQERALAGDSLARLGDTRIPVIAISNMKFCYVPKGILWMGNNAKNAYENERPHHEVELSEFYISLYPVTVAQYYEFVNAGGYQDENFWEEAIEDKLWKTGQLSGRSKPDYDYSTFNLKNHPVVGITWYEAAAFTRWLTKHWRDAGHLSENEIFRLPTEAEWEKAARGGDTIPKEKVIVSCCEKVSEMPEIIKNPLSERLFPWGNEIDSDRCNYIETKIGATNAVGCFATGVGPHGCEETSGNVLEWCLDWYGKYPTKKTVDPKGPAKSPHKVARGGSWANSERHCRLSNRGFWKPDACGRYLGFRVVRVAT